ncbi:MAG: glycosyltransferase, partial [Candidatus Marinimicrobia bacterium]|nr:glycosyltransferase [Candidatus Neomarinimicrobiota bacterium]
MIVFTAIALIGTLSYFYFILYILSGLRRLKPAEGLQHYPSVSVIIAARNEATNLPALLTSLLSQDYPTEKLEILISDDRSTDNSWEIIQSFQKNSAKIIGIRVSEESDSMTPKKNALSQAIEQSSGEIIVTTDGDCRVQSTWVKSMVEAIGDKAGICVGFSAVE